MLNGMTYTRV